MSSPTSEGAPHVRPFDLSGRTALVVGGTGGIGAGVVRALRLANAQVCVGDVSVMTEGPLPWDQSVLTIPMDITNETSVAEGVQRAQDLGRVSILVNCAGVLHVRDSVEVSLEAWRALMRVNLEGTFLTCREFVKSRFKYQVDRGDDASIVNISSVAGKLGDPKLAAYSASKAGIIGLTQALAREWGGVGVRVNSVCPGVVETSMIEDLASDWGVEVSDVVADQVLRVAQTPLDIGRACVFLSAMSVMTGQSINVDGGTVFH